MNYNIVVSNCDTYDSNKIFSLIKNNLEILGMKDCIRPKSKVLLKPNLLNASHPDKAVTTHPEFVRALIKLVRSFSAEPVVADSPSTLNVDEVYKICGIDRVCREEKAELVNLSKKPIKKIKFQKYGIENISISSIVDEVDFVISIPKLKTHSLMGFTCGVKNIYGLVPGLVKALYHKYAPLPEEFIDILIAVYNYVKPGLNVVDGILGMDGNGPASGNIKRYNLLICSKSGFLIDLFLYRSLGKIDSEILKKLENNVDEDIKIYYHNISEDILNKKNVSLPDTTQFISFIPSTILSIIKKFVWFKPIIIYKTCKKCGKCYSICPQKTIVKVDDKYKIIYKDCIRCFCCSESCAFDAIKIKKSLLLNIIFIINRFRDLIFNSFKYLKKIFLISK